MTRWRLLACALAVLAAGSVTASAPQKVTKGTHCPHRIVTAHFVIEFSVPAEMGSEYAGLCEKAYRKLHDLFPLRDGEKVWEEHCYIILFATHGEFLRFAATIHGRTAAHSGGYTSINRKRPLIVLFLHNNDHTLLKQTLIHEMTHVFLGLFRTEGHINTWLHEGFAQYFEFQHKPERSRRGLWLKVVKAMVAQGRTVPLARFWRAQFPPTDAASYAQAWSLVDFMASSKSLRRRTGRFIVRLKEGKSQEQALREAFGASLTEFEAAWKQYVLKSY